jgi:hypothetical protein
MNEVLHTEVEHMEHKKVLHTEVEHMEEGRTEVPGIAKTNKKRYSCHFTKYNTRQRGTLLSTMTISLGKEGTPENQ